MLNITEFLKTESKFYKTIYLLNYFSKHKNGKQLTQITSKINELLTFDIISLENEIINNLTNQSISIDSRRLYYNKYVYDFLGCLTMFVFNGCIIDKRSEKNAIRRDNETGEFYELKSVSENELNAIQKKEYKNFKKKLVGLMSEINNIMDRVELVVEVEFANLLSRKNGNKFHNNQRYYLLESIGLLSCDLLKGGRISQGSKYELIATILDIDVRTAKGFLNCEEKYYPNDKSKEIVKTYLKDLK